MLNTALICILIIMFIVFNCIMYQYMEKKHTTIKEGYESLTSCLDQGYPKDFCFSVPIQSCLTNCALL